MIFVQNLRVWDSFWCLWSTCELWGGCCKNISQGGDLAFYLRDARKAVYDAGLYPAGMFFFSGAEKRTKRDIHPNQTFPYMGRLNRSSCRSYIKVRSDHQRSGVIFYRLRRARLENTPHEEVFRGCPIFGAILSLGSRSEPRNEIRNAVWAKRVLGQAKRAELERIEWLLKSDNRPPSSGRFRTLSFASVFFLVTERKWREGEPYGKGNWKERHVFLLHLTRF